MSEEKQRTSRKAPSMRSGATGRSNTVRSENKSRSFRDETFKPADPSKPEPQTIYLNTTTVKEKKASDKSASPLSRLKDKYKDVFGTETASTGSSYKRQQAQRNLRNDLLKKGIIGLAALIILILIVVVIVNSVQVRDVSNLSIDSTATTQTLKWSGVKRGLSYEVYRAEGAGGEYTLIETLANGETSRTYDNLTAGTLYRYNIRAVKGNGDKTPGSTVEGYTKPNSVTGTSAVTTAEKSLTAVWNLQGSTESYELKYSLYDNLRDATIIPFTANEAGYNSSTNTYSYTIPNLVLDETYYMSMRTICADTASEWSSTFKGTVSDTITSLDIDPDQPMVALTFDGGPDGGTVTTRILDTLSANNSHATFFQTGANAELYPELMKRIVNEGHEMGNHTYDETHVGGDITAEDILNANESIAAACGITPKLFRAPEGFITDVILDTCTDAGMSIVLWNFDSHDWEIYDPAEIVARIQAYVEDGDIIQFRNVYDETAAAIETLVPYLQEHGFQLVTVSQLIQSRIGSMPQPGSIYRSAYDYE